MLSVFRRFPALPVCSGQLSERSTRRSHAGDLAPVLKLDPVGLHLRDEVNRDPDLQVL